MLFLGSVTLFRRVTVLLSHVGMFARLFLVSAFLRRFLRLARVLFVFGCLAIVLVASSLMFFGTHVTGSRSGRRILCGRAGGEYGRKQNDDEWFHGLPLSLARNSGFEMGGPFRISFPKTCITRATKASPEFVEFFDEPTIPTPSDVTRLVGTMTHWVTPRTRTDKPEESEW